MVTHSSTRRRSVFSLACRLALPALGLLFLGSAARGGTAAGTWTPVPTQIIRPVARTGQSLASFDGGAILFGGRTPATGGGSTVLSDLWEYKASTAKFTRLNSTTPLPPPRAGHAAASAPGIFMYMFFGAAQDGTLLDDVWYYDHFRRCWEPEASNSAATPAARMEHSAVATSDNKYLVFGGRGGDGSTLLGDLWSYQPLGRTWTRLADAPDGGRYGHAAVLLDGRMYVLGGTSAAGANHDVWLYDLTQNAWTLLTSDGDVPGPFTGSAAGAGNFGGSAPGQLLLVGGHDEVGSDLNTTYAITPDPVNHLAHWTRQVDYGNVFQATAAAIDRPAGRGTALDLLLFGGSAAGTPLDQAAVYTNYVAPPPGADLTASWVIQKRVSKGSGTRQKFTLSGTLNVLNQGTTKTAASTLRLRLSADGTVDPGDTTLKDLKVAALAPGKAKKIKWSVTLPAGQTGQGQFVIAQVDALSQVAESNETNNVAVSAPF